MRSHTLEPFTRLMLNKRNFKWTKIKQDALNQINRIVARDTLLTCLDFNETFKINTNASAFQLGSVIIQKGKPINLYSRKITDPQKRYTVTEQKLTIIV